MRQFVLHFPPSLFAFFDLFVAFGVFVDFISSLLLIHLSSLISSHLFTSLDSLPLFALFASLGVFVSFFVSLQVEVMRERVGDMADLVTGYGHVGDGNLHLNIVGTNDELASDLRAAIEPFV
jgi:hypothetical protein